MCTSRATQRYGTVTIHFITDNWELESAVIETSLLPGSHKRKRVAEKVVNATQGVKLSPHAVVAVVHDKARNAELAG